MLHDIRQRSRMTSIPVASSDQPDILAYATAKETSSVKAAHQTGPSNNHQLQNNTLVHNEADQSQSRLATCRSESDASTDVDCNDEIAMAGGKGVGGEVEGMGGRAVVVVLPETFWSIITQVSVPYLIAGVGMVAAGTVLNIVKRWPVFVDISEIFILVPALLGLKGNLEMTLASRLSTQANLGRMDTNTERWKLILGNLALSQVQAVVVGLLSALFAITLTWLPPSGRFDFNHAELLVTSSVLTASLASLILGSVVSLVVVISRHCYINPDNVATPIAGSLGDLTTILLLAWIATLLHLSLLDDNALSHWIAPGLLFLVFFVDAPLCCYAAYNNAQLRPVLYMGWTPVIGGMVISSLGGLVLDRTILKFEGIAVFQPVINGVGGNLVGIQASRLSTSLHRVSKLGTAPSQASYGCPNPLHAFCSTNMGALSARVLLFLVLPGQLVFTALIHATHDSTKLDLTPTFILYYLLVALLQVALLLLAAHWLVHYLWSHGLDPDSSSIPYLTAIGDLLGALLLAAAFYAATNSNIATAHRDTLSQPFS